MQIKSCAFALSASQKNILALERRYAGTSINIISASVNIDGRVDFGLLSRALNLILQADAPLRTRLVFGEKEVLQTYADYEPEQFPVYDFTLTDPKGFAHWQDAVTRQPMGIDNEPLCRFFLFKTGQDQGGVLIKSHHIIFDGWSQVLLCNRIAETYLALLENRQPELEPCPGYETHVRQENEYLDSKARSRDEEYWKSQLEAPAEPMSFKQRRGAGVSPVGRRRSYKLPEVLNHAIAEFCRTHRVSPFAPYYMALTVAAKRMGGGNRLMVGVPIHNRADLVARQTTGMFVSTLPLIMELSENWTAEEFNDALSENWLDLLRHQRYPFELIEALPRRGEGRIFDVALSYQDNLRYHSENATVHFSGRWNYSGYQAEQLCIHLTNLEDHRRYTVDYDYLAQLFTDSEIDRLHKTVCAVLDQLLSCPDRPIKEVSILSSQERERVLYTFNNTARRRQDASVWESFAATAHSCPSRVALIDRGEKTTYETLYRRAMTIGGALSDRCRGAEEPLIALMLPRGEELATAMLAVSAMGGGWLIISPELPAGRAAEILAASGAQLLIKSGTDSCESETVSFSTPVILYDTLISNQPKSFQPPKTAGESLAYVVYTSGSTGKPKGVEITNANLVNFSRGMKTVFAAGAILSLSNVSFDAFVLECAVSMLNGLTVVFATDAQQEDPDAMAGLITGYGVDYMCMTPSRLETYLEYPEFCRALSGRKGILCGGEAFSGELLDKLKKVTNAHIYNQYGPSETTVGVSIAELNHCSAITVGTPMENCRLYVLDDRLSPLPTGIYGELYIGGKNVGRGYRGAPELTEKAFMPDPFVTSGRMYRSGDVACWTAEGEVSLGGRADRQLKIRGQRAEPEELAFCLAGYPGIKKTAVRATESFGQTVLYAYYTADTSVSEGALMGYLADRLPVYLLPAGIIKLDNMPITASGKVNERELPLPEPDSVGGAPETPAQTRLLEVFREVLGRPELSADGDYFLFGGNSLNAMETVSRLEPIVGRRLRVSDLYACRTARKLDAMLSGGDGAQWALSPILPAEAREYYPLSDIQKNIYIQCRMAPDSLAYHMPGAFALSAAPDENRLENAFRALIAGDDLYRTAFDMESGSLAARILPAAEFELTRLSADSFEEAWAEFLRPFDLAKPPLVRAALWKNGEDETLLFVDVHHIVGDGVSTSIMLKRLDELYSGLSDGIEKLTYKDYCCYREGLNEDEAVAQWAEHLSPLPEKLDLPGDMPKPHPFDFKGGAYSFTLPEDTTRRCNEICDEQKLTPYMLFAAAYGLLLARVSGRRDMLVGTPVSGRSRKELWQICGPFLSTLPLRLSPDEKMSAGEYLSAVRDEVLWMLDHQELPLDKVVTALELPRQVGENPLYQVMFTYRPLDVETLTLDGGAIEVLNTPHQTAKVELLLEAAKTGDKFEFVFEYAASIFDLETIKFYARCLTAILDGLTAGESIPLDRIDALGGEDRLRLMEMPRQMTVPFRNVPVDVLVAEQARRTPEADAVIFRGETITYRQLEARAEFIAGRLQSAGAVINGRIGLCCRRGPDIMAGMLAILKTGCAYVPFLADFPQARIRYMLETAGADTVLCDGESADMLSDLEGVKTVTMDGEAAPYKPSGHGEVMYVLFTSGSTGKPKGVMVTNRADANYCAAIGRILNEDSGPVLCVTNMTFDIFQTESLLPLALGRTVALCDEDERTLPWRMAQCISDNGVTTMQMTPSQFEVCLGNKEFALAVKNIKLLILTGEATGERLAREVAKASPASLINLYGPTETTVYVSSSRLCPGERVTIGKPLQNCRMYVMNGGEEVLPTAVGELYIAGECLSKGYIGRPELTEKAFVPDPLFPGELMYRTGDLARLRVDGNVECLGRADSQIKLNGLRIELDEINGAALQSGLVSQCVTVPTGEGAGVFLRAFAVPEGEATPTADTLKTFMKTLLPDYMLPAEFVFLHKLPLNPSGKVDMPALKNWTWDEKSPLPPEKISPAVSHQSEPVPDSTAVGEMIRTAWREVLGREDIDENQSFFSQGGTSLGALETLTRYYNGGCSMTLADFYANPTITGQLELLAGDKPGETQPASAPEIALPSAEFTPRPAPTAKPGGDSLPARRVLLTGATGFLGAHLLYELTDTDLAGEVVCLLRDGDSARLIAVLEYYFGKAWVEKNAGRVSVLKGDITKSRFDLGEHEYSLLAAGTDAVFHTAADVRHYASDSKGWMTNVFGTAHAAQFALDAEVPFNHVSTMSVSGEYITYDRQKTAVFTENDFDIGQNWHDNIYVEGKFLAEREIYDRMERGLNARIYRLGRLVGRDRDGVFQKNPTNNAVYLTFRGIQAAGALPRSMALTPIDLTPVDYCAKAIAALSNGPMPVCHIADPQPVSMFDAAQAIDPKIELLSDEAFAARLNMLSGGERSAELAPLVEVWNRALHDGPARINPDWSKTTGVLAALGVAKPKSPPETRLREYRVKIEEGSGIK